MQRKGTLTILTGAPGCGKTTVAGLVAAAHPMGVHLVADHFHTFPAHPIDPTTPASHAQNTTIVRALARAAHAYAEGGYRVVVDGIVGPWFLDVFRAELPAGFPLGYVVLEVPLEVALARVSARQGPGASGAVRKMHREFGKAEVPAGHRVDAVARSAAEIARTLADALEAGGYRLRA